MPRLTITNTAGASAAVFNSSALIGGGQVTNLGGNTSLTVDLDDSKVAILRHRATGEPFGVIVDEDVPGVYRHPTTGTAPAFLLINSTSVRTGSIVTFDSDEIEGIQFTA